MPDGFIQLPVDGAGKKLRTFVLPSGEHAEAIVLVDHNGDLVSSPESPQSSALTSANLAAGASVDLDATAITTGKTGKLAQIIVAASVPLKAELKTVAAGVPTTRAVLFTTDADLTRIWEVPAGYYSLVGGATSRFRLTVTNLDTVDAADVYASVLWDEITT